MAEDGSSVDPEPQTHVEFLLKMVMKIFRNHLTAQKYLKNKSLRPLWDGVRIPGLVGESRIIYHHWRRAQWL